MEPVVTVEELEELPWGPSSKRLIQPLAVTVTEDGDTDTVTIHCEGLGGLSGDGSDFTEALFEFAAEVEALADDLRSSGSDLADPVALKLLGTLDRYVPYDEE